MTEGSREEPAAGRSLLIRSASRALTFASSTWLMVGSCLVFVAFLELAAATALWLLGSQAREPSEASAPPHVWHVEDPGYVWRPFVYWRSKPASSDGVNIDENGLRRTWNARRPAEPGSVIRVFVFGGSTTLGAGARDEFTIPSLLSKELAEAAEIAVEVSNFGQTAYVSTQELIALMLELQRGNVPDVVVFYDGANDAFASYQAGRAGVPQNEEWRRLDYESPARAFVARLMRRSSIIGLVRRLAGPSFGTWEPPEEGSLASLGRDTVGRYAANVRLSEALAAAYRFDVLHYWQPVIWSKPPPLNDYEEGILRSMDRQHPFLEGLGRAVYAAIGEEPGLAANRRFHDLSRVFGADDFVFWDWCHLSETGNRRIADEIGRDVRALLATRAEALARASEAVLPPGAASGAWAGAAFRSDNPEAMAAGSPVSSGR